LIAFVAAVPAIAHAAPPSSPAKALEEQLQKVIDDATPSVVAIVVSHSKEYDRLIGADAKIPGKLGDYRPAARPEPGLLLPGTGPPLNRRDLSLLENVADNQFGSGLVLDADKGLILTPYHLIEGATKIFVRTSAGKGSYADIHAADAKSDLAVLRLIYSVNGLSNAKLGTVQFVAAPDGTKPNLKRGSMLVAVGHPLASGFADGQPSGSWGILSNIRRRSAAPPQREDLRSNKPLHQYGSLIQTDARIAIGSSGAALLNLDGEVIGLSSAVAAVNGSEAAGGYAVPFDMIYRRIISVLLTGREVDYGFLGVFPTTADGGGALINNLTPGCPAAIGGLKNLDIIREVDGNELKDSEDLLLYIGGALAGTEVTITVGSKAKPVQKKIVLAKIANPLASIASVPPPSFRGLRVDYSSVELIKLAIQNTGIRYDDPPVGVCIRELEPGTAAEKKLKDAGDSLTWIITHVDDKPVANPKEFFKATADKTSAKLKFADPRDSSRSVSITIP
jgi:serine protease Do